MTTSINYTVYYFVSDLGVGTSILGFHQPSTSSHLSFSGSTISGGMPLLWTLDGRSIGATYTGYTNNAGDPIVNDGTYNWLLTNSSAASAITVRDDSFGCFLQGTRIATPAGEVPVERLQPGMRVRLALGGEAVVRWVGHRRINALFCNPIDARPVRVAAGAFADGVPHRDLWLSPDHAILVDGVLIPVRHLINDATIQQEDRQSITYWHVELGWHAALLAEGLPAESYLDTGNRAFFATAVPCDLQPRFGLHDRAAWDMLACAPLVEDGPRLDAVRARLTDRAALLGRPVPDAVTLEIGSIGEIITYVPAHATRVRLRSTASRPAGEARRLGAAIARLEVSGIAVPLDSERLARGFHRLEDGLRWTDGDAMLLLDPVAVPRRMVLNVVRLAA